MLTYVAPVAAASGTISHPITWLAAGDSYASGQGLLDPSGPCERGTGKDGSGLTWALSGASTLKGSGVSVATGSPDLVACTGAISDQFFNADGSANAPQWNPKKMKPFDLVTFSFGGDDIGFKRTIEICTVTHICPSASTERNKIAAMGTTGVTVAGRHIPSYPTFLNHVATTAVVKGGNVIVMGYPQVFEDPATWDFGRTNCSGYISPIVDRMRGWGADLNATIGESVAKIDAEPPAERNSVQFTFINPVNGGGVIPATDHNLLEPSTGTHHELCSKADQPWINGFSAKHLTHSYHPNQDGENAMGKLAAEVIPKLTWPWTPTTRIAQYSPLNASGTPVPGLNVTDGGDASCGAGSDVVDAAYRCFATSGILDPCWYESSNPSTPTVLCQEEPWSTEATQLTVPVGLGQLSGSGSTPSEPWGVKLTNGANCLAAQGAHNNYNGVVINFSCVGGLYLLGDENQSDPLWTFQSVTASGESYIPAPTSSVAIAYLALPSASPSGPNACTSSALVAAASAYEQQNNPTEVGTFGIGAFGCVGGYAIASGGTSAAGGYGISFAFQATDSGWNVLGVENLIADNNDLGIPNSVVDRISSAMQNNLLLPSTTNF